MVMVLGVTGAPTATTATLSFTGAPGTGTIDYQLSPRADFSFCVAPIYNCAVGASVNLVGLNQRCTYFARARTRAVDGITVSDWTNVTQFRTADGTAQDTAATAIMITPAIIVLPEVPIFITDIGAGIAGYPVQSLLRDSPVGWKASPISGHNHSVEFQMAGQPIDTIALLNTNLPENTLIDIWAAPTQADLSNAGVRTLLLNSVAFRASSNLPGRNGYHGLFQFSQSTLPWWHIEIHGTTTTGDLAYIEHLVIGRNRTSKNHSVDKTETPITKSTIDRTRAGVADRQPGIPMRKSEFEISVLDAATYETVYGDLVSHENEAVLAVPNSKAGGFLHDRILFGDMKASRIFNPYAARFTRGFSIESLI